MKKNNFLYFLQIAFVLLAITANAQRNETKAKVSNTPLHLLQPDYPVPYGKVEIGKVTKVLNRIHGYLDAVTPAAFVNSKTGEKLTDLSKIDENTILEKSDFRLVSYEWGVTYALCYWQQKRRVMLNIKITPIQDFNFWQMPRRISENQLQSMKIGVQKRL